MSKRPFKTFDLPVEHIDRSISAYVPPKARYEAEIERRAENPRGTLILESQRDGTEIAYRTLQPFLREHKSESFAYVSQKLAAVCLNTAWHSFANVQPIEETSSSDDVNRRRLWLPEHAQMDEDGIVHYETKSESSAKIWRGFMDAIGTAENIETLKRNGFETRLTKQTKLYGRTVGALGLRLAASHLVGRRGESAYEIQKHVREAGRRTIEDSRQVFDGAHPTIAQLADLDSPLSVHVRKTAPTPVYDALITATDTVRQQRAQRYES